MLSPMWWNSKIIPLLLFFVFTLNSYCFSQLSDYQYQRRLDGISGTWHKIVLPNSLYGKVNKDFSDIRIYGILPGNDTVVVPYILQVSAEKIEKKDISFQLINQTKNEKGYFYTLEVPTSTKVNEVKLNFIEPNFDWQVNLEGSQDGKEWFTIVENYRILSIQNSYTNYQFTTLRFNDAKFKFFRLLIKTQKEPGFKNAILSDISKKEGSYIEHSDIKMEVIQNKKEKQSIIDISLPAPVPVATLELTIKNNYDYYRPVSISYLLDSSNAPKGWIYHYQPIYNGTLSSLEKPVFTWDNIITQKIRLIIDNYDNPPLNVSSVKVRGNNYVLMGRFLEDASYFLLYGNKEATQPVYDLQSFIEKIPENAETLTIGPEETIKEESPKTSAMFENKIWLWGIMLLVIAVLGTFTLKMLKSQPE